MNAPDEFEKKLSGTPLRGAPKAWRAEILRSAVRNAPATAIVPGWRHALGGFLRLERPFWKGMAAAWALAAALEIDSRLTAVSINQSLDGSSIVVVDPPHFLYGSQASAPEFHAGYPEDIPPPSSTEHPRSAIESPGMGRNRCGEKYSRNV